MTTAHLTLKALTFIAVVATPFTPNPWTCAFLAASLLICTWAMAEVIHRGQIDAIELDAAWISDRADREIKDAATARADLAVEKARSQEIAGSAIRLVAASRNGDLS